MPFASQKTQLPSLSQRSTASAGPCPYSAAEPSVLSPALARANSPVSPRPPWPHLPFLLLPPLLLFLLLPSLSMRPKNRDTAVPLLLAVLVTLPPLADTPLGVPANGERCLFLWLPPSPPCASIPELGPESTARLHVGWVWARVSRPVRHRDATSS